MIHFTLKYYITNLIPFFDRLYLYDIIIPKVSCRTVHYDTVNFKSNATQFSNETIHSYGTFRSRRDLIKTV